MTSTLGLARDCQRWWPDNARPEAELQKARTSVQRWRNGWEETVVGDFRVMYQSFVIGF